MTPTKVSSLTVDDLPRFSLWPARLLGLAAWQSLCSIGERFELLTARETLRRHYQLVTDTLYRLLAASCIVELGAGYGGAVLRLAPDTRSPPALVCGGIYEQRQRVADATCGGNRRPGADRSL